MASMAENNCESMSLSDLLSYWPDTASIPLS